MPSGKDAADAAFDDLYMLEATGVGVRLYRLIDRLAERHKEYQVCVRVCSRWN